MGRLAGFAVVVGVGLMVFLASALALALPSQRSFHFTGREQSYVVPRGVTLVTVNALGAVGGPTATIGQSGLALTAYLPVKPGEVLFTEVGQPGSDQGGPGFGGGGAAGRDIHENIVDAGSGGGATDVRICSEHAAKCVGGGSSTGSRLIVAGGGGGSGGTGAGSGNLCGNSTGGGSAGASTGGGSQGGQAVVTAAGTVILASHGESGAPSTPAGGGSRTAAGSGGSEANCAAGTGTTLTGSAPGSSGNGPVGGAGATAAGTTGGGGGGGGGYFGGGGGASGWQGCNPNGCSVSSTGGGGGAGSSFVTARAVLAAGGFGPSSAPPSVTYTPQVEIDAPAAGAVYKAGQVVAARWSCVNTITCKGTVASGRPITTTPGKHSFAVNATVSGRIVRSTIAYTVKRKA